jgi:cell wall-associated NlpC family hydrolase
VTDATAAIAGIQTTLAALRGTPVATTSTSSSSSVFEAILKSLTSASSASSTQEAFGQKLVDDARDYLGTPYVLGGRSKNGIDCSGLVKNVLETYGIDAQHDSGKQGQMGTEIASLAEAEPGDLITFPNGQGGTHIGIYAGDNKIIHAPKPGRNVVEQELWTGDAGILSIRRIEAPASEAAAAPQVDMSQVLSGLAMLGNLSSLLGSTGLGASGFGTSALTSALPSTLTPTALGAAELNQLQTQRWALLAKGIS